MLPSPARRENKQLSINNKQFLNDRSGLMSPLFIDRCLLFIRRIFWRCWLRLKYHLFQRARHEAVTLEKVGRFDVLALPSVMNPVLFLTGKWFVEQLSAETIPPHSTVLDMGCGTGIAGLAAATWADMVVSADINPTAVRCATINSQLNKLEHKISAVTSDLFNNLQGQKFDVVLFNPPFYSGQPDAGFDQAWRTTSTIAQQFARQLRHHFTPTGYALILLSSLGNPDQFLDAFTQQGYTTAIAASEDVGSERFTLYKICDAT